MAKSLIALVIILVAVSLTTFTYYKGIDKDDKGFKYAMICIGLATIVAITAVFVAAEETTPKIHEIIQQNLKQD